MRSNLLRISGELKEVLRTGRLAVYSPSKDNAEMVSILYLDADVVSYVWPEKILEHPEIVDLHYGKLEQLVADLQLPWRLIGKIWAVIAPLFSLAVSLYFDGNYLRDFIITGAVGLIAHYTRSAMGKLVLHLLSLKLRKELGG
ncbi:hypothetical protein [Mangrovibacterium lignilyticum]|uniref:hypothetical protein n=1 Tax=Mangrovibacterium lignilyticum TaxID=2668052 RepID=UPI0013D52588|nr:hypothetical protein [Mangrovibacterium lignilyticum]